ncbi:hypothetical protein K4K52_010122 [Colletotrichum sp. SAR 10_76]|nr:hypothetical protein K4K52_010122 [Colletotrichum sp. SAR 10_76]
MELDQAAAHSELAFQLRGIYFSSKLRTQHIRDYLSNVKVDPPTMSGFEVAGIVLGTIPLLISALEHYKEGISTIRAWRNYDRELRSLIRNLQTERVRFQDVCEKLLVGLVSQRQIESMVDDPFGPAWQEEKVRAKIEARLWRSFNNFEDIVKDMEEAAKEMRTKLDLQPDGTVKWQEATLVIREFKRASFVLRRSDHAEQMATIKEGITSLESVIDRNIQLEPGRKLRSQGRLMRLVREISGGVYRAIRRCPALLALGILLLELNLGRTIESLRFQYEMPPPGAPRLMYDSMTAQRLLQERQMDSLNYKSAVQRCIWGEFARQKLDLNDEDFRQEIYEKFVALLETDLKNATWSYDVGV